MERTAAPAGMPARLVYHDMAPFGGKPNTSREPGQARAYNMNAAHDSRLWRSTIQIFSARETRTG